MDCPRYASSGDTKTLRPVVPDDDGKRVRVWTCGWGKGGAGMNPPNQSYQSLQKAHRGPGTTRLGQLKVNKMIRYRSPGA